MKFLIYIIEHIISVDRYLLQMFNTNNIVRCRKLFQYYFMSVYKI